jgi:hypothetical protein
MLDRPPTSGSTSDALSLGQVSPEAMDRDELEAEVRRLRLRLEALREQRDERIQQLDDREQQLLAVLRGEDIGWTEGTAWPANAWRERAEEAEAALAALMATRSMRLLRVPRAVYGRLRAARAHSAQRRN